MQKCHFSETQFAFSMTWEMWWNFDFTQFPFLPSTYQEGKLFGYDMCIGSYYLQFKIPKLYERSDFQNPLNSKYWTTFNSDYYQIGLNLDGKQYKTLKAISMHPVVDSTVLYCTPKFHSANDLMIHSFAMDVQHHVFKLNVLNIPPGLTGSHNFIYTHNSQHGVLHSDPILIKDSNDLLESQFEGEKINIRKACKHLRNILIELEIEVEPSNKFEDKWEELVYFQGLLQSECDIYWIPILAR